MVREALVSVAAVLSDVFILSPLYVLPVSMLMRFVLIPIGADVVCCICGAVDKLILQKWLPKCHIKL